MTRGTGLACLAAALLAGPAAARVPSPWSVAVWGGREPVGLADLSGRLAEQLAEDRAGWLGAFGGRTTGTRSSEGLAWGGGWEAARRLGRHGVIGVRLGFAVPHDLRASFSAWGAGDEEESYVTRISASVMQAQAGFALAWDLPAGFRVRSGCWAGPVYASMHAHRDFTFNDPNSGDEEAWSSDAAAAGIGAGAEADAEAGWESVHGVEVFLRLGWRDAAVRTLRWSREADLDGDGVPDLAKGEIAVDGGGGHLRIRASGLVVRLGIRVALH